MPVWYEHALVVVVVVEEPDVLASYKLFQSRLIEISDNLQAVWDYRKTHQAEILSVAAGRRVVRVGVVDVNFDTRTRAMSNRRGRKKGAVARVKSR